MKKKRFTEAKAWGVAAHIVLTILCILAVLPFILLVVGSFTDNKTAMTEGFSFFPHAWSL